MRVLEYGDEVVKVRDWYTSPNDFFPDGLTGIVKMPSGQRDGEGLLYDFDVVWATRPQGLVGTPFRFSEINKYIALAEQELEDLAEIWADEFQIGE